ncbi:unnamed protein product [Paramecium pentaurelia]|uniref:P-loop containing nucleoside triphosphate hydrolase n=1 Tax=Paramecium pentaurelia TaxID=43138 RepID=A0A8S1T837_9CILI|nr:unnamed protein product [Paramecium pentaurelia]
MFVRTQRCWKEQNNYYVNWNDLENKRNNNINGIDLKVNIDAIRENVGISTQRDVLYGLDSQQEINEIIEVTELEEDRDKLIGDSRGKLLLDIALIGGSLVIFQDEPRSGMDAQSRRIIWEILQRVRQQNRKIIQQRIIWMKQKYQLIESLLWQQVNYQLVVNVIILKLILNQTLLQSSSEQLLSIIQDAQIDLQSQSDTKIFLIPFKSKQQWDKLMEIISKEYENQIVINLTLNSLEHVFINIGMDEESLSRQPKEVKQVQMTVKLLWNKKLNNKGYQNSKLLKQSSCVFIQIIIYCYIIKKVLYYFKNIQQLYFYYNPFLFDSYWKNLQDKKIQNNILNWCLYHYLQFQHFALIPLYLSHYQCQRKNSILKYVLTVIGCRVLPFWICTYAFDFYIVLFLQSHYHMGYFVFSFVTFGFAYISFIFQFIKKHLQLHTKCQCFNIEIEDTWTFVTQWIWQINSFEYTNIINQQEQWICQNKK